MTKKNKITTYNGAHEIKGVYLQTSWDPIVFFFFSKNQTLPNLRSNAMLSFHAPKAHTKKPSRHFKKCFIKKKEK